MSEGNPESLTVRFEITRDDQVQASYSFLESPVAKAQRRQNTKVALTIMGVSFVAMVLRVLLHDRNLNFAFAGTFALALFLLLVPVINKSQIPKQVDQRIAEYPILLGKREVTIGSSGLEHRADLFFEQFDWRAIHSIHLDPDDIAFFVNRINWVWVPRRAFASDDAFRAFAKAASTFYEARSRVDSVRSAE